MHTELFCKNLPGLDPIRAVRAIHLAWLQLCSIETHPDRDHDNLPALQALGECLAEAGHPEFPKQGAPVETLSPDASTCAIFKTALEMVVASKGGELAPGTLAACQAALNAARVLSKPAAG